MRIRNGLLNSFTIDAKKEKIAKIDKIIKSCKQTEEFYLIKTSENKNIIIICETNEINTHLSRLNGQDILEGKIPYSYGHMQHMRRCSGRVLVNKSGIFAEISESQEMENILDQQSREEPELKRLKI